MCVHACHANTSRQAEGIIPSYIIAWLLLLGCLSFASCPQAKPCWLIHLCACVSVCGAVVSSVLSCVSYGPFFLARRCLNKTPQRKQGVFCGHAVEVSSGLRHRFRNLVYLVLSAANPVAVEKAASHRYFWCNLQRSQVRKKWSGHITLGVVAVR